MMFYSDEELGIDVERSENSLHVLYRTLPHPESMLETTQELLQTDIDVNLIDRYGNTPLSYLVLHINRGLRYHAYTIPQIQSLVDLNASDSEIEKTCIALDDRYQQQVYECIELLLSKGANPNYIPERCPSIAHDLEWTKAYENKLLQQEGRWHLLDRGLKMDYTKFNFFDPVTVGKIENTMKVNTLHVAAWRGSARCLKALLSAGADVNFRASDGRNALHFLYQYCNKPMDLVEATRVLVNGGIFPAATDSFGQAPFQNLLKHTLISRSYVKYLANSYTEEYCLPDQSQDHYQNEVRDCTAAKSRCVFLMLIEALIQAGQDVQHKNKWQDGALHILLYHFSSSLEDAEVDFQVRRHYLVPYQFRLKPVTNMMQYLLEKGCEVNDKDGCGRTALHLLVQLLQNLIFHEELNSVQDVKRCLNVLFKFKANPNLESNYGQTASHIMAQVMKSKCSQIQQYTQILEVLINNGLDLNARDRFGKGILHYLMQTKSPSAIFEGTDMERLIILLLRSGADPNLEAEAQSVPGQFMFYEHERKYPLTLLLRSHIFHHNPMEVSPRPVQLEGFVKIMDIICQCMSTEALQRVFYQYCDNGVCGVFCERQCRVSQVLYNNTTQPRPLSHICRLRIWKSAGPRLNDRINELPLPRDIRAYIKWS